MKELRSVALALQELRDAGVVVLWRPLHEMNGNWFWWGMESHPGNPEPYVALWRQMHEVFTEDFGLNNLLWVYSVIEENDPSWTRPVTYYYPGNDVVDIVGVDAYTDVIQIKDYKALTSFGKPIGLTEFGPGTALSGGGDYDNSLTIEALQAKYPKIAFWLQWHDWQKDGEWVRKSIRHNQNSDQLFKDPRVITLERVDWKSYLNTIDLNNGKDRRPY